MLGHLTGRLLLRREAYQGGYAPGDRRGHRPRRRNRSSMPIPQRLDMDWRHWRKARPEQGLLCSINPDAHDTEGLDHVRAGVNAARKGWLTAENVLNTRTLPEVQAWLDARRSRAIAAGR